LLLIENAGDNRRITEIFRNNIEKRRFMKKVLNYDTLGWALKSLSDACFKAAEQQKNGEKVTACGMSDDDLDNLCEQIPFMLNPYMTAGQVKKEAHISESTLRRAIADGELESVGNAGDHSHFFKKWDVREFIKKRLKRNKN
jgi:hypothetical protein